MGTIKYKAFCELSEDNLLVNNYGDTFEIGVDYKIDGNLKYGNEGNGYHFASTFVDCFRFVNSDSPILCEVLVSGRVIPYDDEYYGYYDMGVSENIKIVRVVPRKEVIEMAYNLHTNDKIKFIVTYPLSDDEFNYFKTGFVCKSESLYGEYRAKIKKLK